MVEGESETRELLLRIRSGDREAWEGAFERVARRLRPLIRRNMDRRLQGRVDVSDVVQETLLESLRRDAAGRAAEDGADPLARLLFLAQCQLQRLARHHLGTRSRDVRRECGPGAVSEPDAPSCRPEAALDEQEVRAEVNRALEDLRPEDREILGLRIVEGLRPRELAARLGVPVETVRKRFFRAMARLKARLEPGNEAGAR